MEALIECDWNGSSSGYSGEVIAADRNAISASAPRREWVNERASAGDNAEEAKGRVTDEKMEEDLQNQFRHSQPVPMSFSGLFGPVFVKRGSLKAIKNWWSSCSHKIPFHVGLLWFYCSK
jgi:hypothetical protein